MESDVQPQKASRFNLLSLPQCTATAKHSGERCKQRCVNGRRVCWLHGGRGGAPKGNKNRLTHGMRTREAQEERRQIREVIRLMKSLMGDGV